MNRNLFDLDNARYLHKKELVETFIATESFERLLSPKNQIIIGSRGSGKTALLKMISHDHLTLFDNIHAKEVIKNKTYIGIHISTKTKFAGGLKNKEWQSDNEKENHFKWLMNIASCVALLDTIKSCLNTYFSDTDDKITKELSIVSKIKAYWFSESDQLFTLDDLAQRLEEIVLLKSKRNLELKIFKKTIDENPIGLTFELELFDPLIGAIQMVNRILKFPDYTSWFICIDEIEILDEFHHRILNSYMRANLGNIFFKFTTLPYCHYTLETNLKVPLDIRHDIHYVYIDQDISFQYRATEKNSNVLKLFKKRAEISKPDFAGLNFMELFGKSPLLDSRIIDYTKIINSKSNVLSEEELREGIENDVTLTLFTKHTNEKTLKKGLDLLRRKRIKEFGDQFGRKLRALLYLKEYEKSISGNQNVELYCGAKTVINVGDANPRKLIGIFNEMISKIELDENKVNKSKSKDQPIIPYSVQNFVLASVAEKELNRYRIEKNFGESLYEFINIIGKYMYENIHNSKINSEQISSFEFTKGSSPKIWKVIERSVQKGLIYPNINVHNPDDMPYEDGVFHLAFIFAPKFKLLPRKGDSRNIDSILMSQQLTIEFDD